MVPSVSQMKLCLVATRGSAFTRLYSLRILRTKYSVVAVLAESTRTIDVSKSAESVFGCCDSFFKPGFSSLELFCPQEFNERTAIIARTVYFIFRNRD